MSDTVSELARFELEVIEVVGAFSNEAPRITRLSLEHDDHVALMVWLPAEGAI